MDFEDDAFDIDLDMDEVAAPKAVFVFDPEGGAATAEALGAVGIAADTVALGSELMAAAGDERVAGVIVSAMADEELRDLFMRMFTGRFPHIPVVFLSEGARNREVVSQLSALGASAVLPWPLPGPEDLLPRLKAVFDIPEPEPEPAPASEPNAASAEGDPFEDEQSVLARKIDKMEQAQVEVQGLPAQFRSQQVVTSNEYEAAIQRAVESATENTNLLTEVDMMRERNRVLEERLKRVTEDLVSVAGERDRMMQAAHVTDEQKLGLNEKAVEDLAALAQRFESYLYALEQAIRFFEDLKVSVGDRAPSLDAHMRTFRLAHSLLERYRQKTQSLT